MDKRLLDLAAQHNLLTPLDSNNPFFWNGVRESIQGDRSFSGMEYYTRNIAESLADFSANQENEASHLDWCGFWFGRMVLCLGYHKLLKEEE